MAAVELLIARNPDPDSRLPYLLRLPLGEACCSAPPGRGRAHRRCTATPFSAATVGMVLQKTCRTTNFTTGQVVNVNATVDVNYGGGKVARFCRQFITTGMSAGGDSDSLVLDTEEGVAGLLFAGRRW
jgi:hypothetical protein